MKQQVLSTELAPLNGKVAAVHRSLCSDQRRKLLIKVSRSVNPLYTEQESLTYEVHEYENDKKGALVYHLDANKILYNSQKQPMVRLSGDQATKGFHAVDLSSDLVLFTLRRVLCNNEPTTIGSFRDRETMKQYTIGYTGSWTKGPLAMIWISTDQDPETRRDVAKVYPSGGLGLNLKYCVEVAPGFDSGVLVLMCYVLDYVGDLLSGLRSV